MMRSLYSAVSGLKNNQTYMDVIGNNISNVNTVGFKSSSVTFQDILSQTLQGASSASGTSGGTNPMQVGLGSGLASISTNFTDGSTQSTGVSTDLAISGQGFFVVGTAQNQMYTRNGTFTTDSLGNFLTSTGLSVLGWQANSAGVVDTTQPIAGITIPVGSSMPAKLSTTISLTGNLNGGATAIDLATMKTNADAALTAASSLKLATAAVLGTAPIPAGAALAAATAADNAAQTALTDATAAQAAAVAAVANPTTATIAAALEAAATALASVTAASTAANTSANTTGTNSTTTAAAVAAAKTAKAAVAAIAKSDSATPVTLPVYDAQGNAYTLTGTITKATANAWTFVPAQTILGGTDGTTVVGTVATGCTSTIKFNADGTFDTSTVFKAIKITPTGPYAGASPFDIQPSGSAMTQYGTDTTAKFTETDGYGAGTLKTTTIASNGQITGNFTNGKTQVIAQIALAVFNNPDGLLSSGNSYYSKTTNSGEPQIGTTSTGGRGTFTPGSLEMSNVDLAQQFTNMIVAQRAFQANSKIITTVDTMLDELVNLKR
jgi:flagellar hook protein FlgE